MLKLFAVLKAIFSFLLLHLLATIHGVWPACAQIKPVTYQYNHPSKDKEAWQRLNLLQSATFIVVTKEGQLEHDTCLFTTSRHLGLSRWSVLAEGIDDLKISNLTKWIDVEQPASGIQMLSGLTGKKRLQLLLLLAAYYAFQPHSYYRYKDSVAHFANLSLKESQTLKEHRLGRQALCLLGKIYVQANDPRGNTIFAQLIEDARRAGDKQTEAKAIAYRGMYAAPSRATFQQKLADLQTGAELYRQLGDAENEINLLTDLGYMLVVTGQLEPARGQFLQALALAETIHFPYTQYLTDALAMVNNYQGKFGETFQYAIQTIKTAEAVRDSIGMAYFFSRLSQLYLSEGREKESVEMAQKSVNRFIAMHDPMVYGALSIVTDDLCSKGRATEALKLVSDVAKKAGRPTTLSEQFMYHFALAGCYIRQNRLAEALTEIQTLDSLETKAEAIRGPLNRTLVTHLYGLLYYQQGQYRKARDFFEQDFTMPSYGQRTFQNNLATHRSLIACDSALGDYQSAVRHYEKYAAVLDSGFQVAKIRQAEELSVLYETQEKESQIASLNQQAKQTRLIKNLFLVGIGLIAFIAALLYRQNRLRKKSSQLISEKNGQLQHLLADKDWLVKEIHHRVKNNLQIIMSLLDAQSVYVNDDAALTAINDSQRRVQAISLIHQRLYQSENSSLIYLPPYVEELVEYLKDSFDNGGRILFETELDPVKLDVAKAIPLGLIINEGIVNAVKYAFPNQQKGKVSVRLKKDGTQHFLFSLSDNGVGLSPGTDPSQQHTLGFSLMQGLARQLDGTFEAKTDGGLHLTMRFPDETT